MQEFGDSARARKLYEQDSDDDGDEELEINIKLEQGMCDNYLVSHNFHIYFDMANNVLITTISTTF